MDDHIYKYLLTYFLRLLLKKNMRKNNESAKELFDYQEDEADDPCFLYNTFLFN